MESKQLNVFEENANVLVNFKKETVDDLTEAAEKLGWSRNKLIRFLCEKGIEELRKSVKI